MILILCEADHLDRAQTLHAATPGSQVLFADQIPMKGIGSVATLTFWGHSAGYGSRFCNYTADQFATRVAEWSNLHPGLQTIETISCNLVHAWDDALELTTDHSFIFQAKAALARTNAHRLGIKTMPQAPSGPGSYSILLWSSTTNTWAYLAAHAGHHPGHTGGDYVLKNLEAFFKFQNPGDLRKIAHHNPNYISLHQDFLRHSNFNVPSHIFIKSGTISNLRSLLVTI